MKMHCPLLSLSLRWGDVALSENVLFHPSDFAKNVGLGGTARGVVYSKIPLFSEESARGGSRIRPDVDWGRLQWTSRSESGYSLTRMLSGFIPNHEKFVRWLSDLFGDFR